MATRETLGPAPIREPYENPNHKGLFSEYWAKWLTLLVKFINTVTPRPYPIQSVAANTTINPKTDCIVLVNCTTGNKTIIVPDIDDVADGQAFCVKKVDASANTVTIQTPDVKTFDGSSTITLTLRYEYVWFACDGSNWQIIG